jgi:hypothetical protein
MVKLCVFREISQIWGRQPFHRGHWSLHLLFATINVKNTQIGWWGKMTRSSHQISSCGAIRKGANMVFGALIYYFVTFGRKQIGHGMIWDVLNKKVYLGRRDWRSRGRFVEVGSSKGRFMTFLYASILSNFFYI